MNKKGTIKTKDGYSICLNKWALDKEIKNDLGLLLIISSLCAEKGYCYASNEYLSKIFNIEEETISRKLKKLETLNYINIDYKRRGCEIIERNIRLTNLSIDDYQKNQSTIDKKVKDNNTSNNITSINNIYIDDIELNELFNEFLKQRKKQKAINSERAINELLNKLKPYDKETQKEMINNALVNSWKSVYPLKNKPQIKESVPKWFNQEIKKETTKDINAIKEMEELLKEYQ